MNRKAASDQPKKKPAPREERLKSALKANMARRKAQVRARDDATRTNKEK
ncbi:hypothetical protein [Maritimibacter sp. HL-12]|jgi:hypothetical protein|nr:hypothetical protein [Maritimibacter sp. HL-12]SMH39840.1 hypothetical protein SAMN05661107_1021 [Maritimibacter sp. HL-12]